MTAPNPLYILKKADPIFWYKCVKSIFKKVVYVNKTYEIGTTPSMEKYGVTPTRYKHTEFANFELEKMMPSTFKILVSKTIIFSLPLLKRAPKSVFLLDFFSTFFEICPISNKMGHWSILIARKE